MERPSIVLVDDDQAVLSALARDVGHEYGDRYRVVRADSGTAALETLRQLKLRAAPVALIVVDQRMPGMTGVELLVEALKIYPNAKRVLLTAYADTEAAIRAINEIRLDYYLTKPWEPPQERLYPVLADLLDDWQSASRRPTEALRLIGHRWSARSHEVKNFLARNLVPYEWMDVETSEEARQLVALAGAAAAQLPLLLFPDGSHLAQPTIVQIAGRLGLRTRAERPSYDLAIVGGGPAGLAAAVYGASEGLHTLLLECEAPGGQAGMSSRIENYLGFPAGLSGGDLARRAVAQATRFGAEILAPQEVLSLRVQDNYRVLTLADGSEVSCQALLIATGVTYRKLGVPGADRLAGAGVYYGAAIPEAIEARGRDVFIVGAGNSAGQAAMYLASFARTVTMLVRGRSLVDSMSQYLIAQIEGTPNIVVRTQSSVVEVLGTEHIEAIRIADARAAGEETLPADALFIFIGATPRTEWIDAIVERDEHGFILSGADVMREGQPPRGWLLERDPFWLETNVPGIFVAGDVRHGSVKRIASAAGEGAMAVQLIHQHLAGPPARRAAGSTSQYVKFLRSSMVFAGLADRDLELLSELAQPIDVPAGHVVIEEGQTGDTLYVVLDGELEVTTIRAGRQVQLALVGQGQLLGEMAVLQAAPRTATVRALRDSRLLVISQAIFLKMLMKNAGALREILRTVAARIRDNEATVMQQAKMASLGTLAAGLAHQLNNPAAAISRRAAHLRELLALRDDATRALAALPLDQAVRARLNALRDQAAGGARLGAPNPLALSDQEERLRSWLEQSGVARAWELAESLAAHGWDETMLGALGAGLEPGEQPAVLRWLGAVASSYGALNDISTGAATVLDLVQAVRTYSYLDRTPVQDVDVRTSLENTLVILKHKLEPGVHVVRDYADDLPRIEAYGGELNQVWAALIDNALDAMQGSGELVLRAYPQGDEVVVEVRDNGPGIPPAVQGRLFEPFYTTKPQGSGTGLGLYISRNIVVERGQGQIRFTSAPGETCFQVRLPVRLKAAEQPSAPAQQAGVAAAR
jgi:thioredoxin reductase (NADPH)